MSSLEKLSPKVSVFVPVYNEEDIINRAVRILNNILQKAVLDYEIFIVNDASQDNTEGEARDIERVNPRVKVLTYNNGPTRRENLAQSFHKGSGDIIVFADIDLISTWKSVANLIQQVAQGYDISIGSRYVPGAKIRRKPFRHFVSVVYNFFIRLLYGTGVADHMCGFKAFKRHVILKLVDELGFDESWERGIFWDTELIIRARRNGYTIKEIPVWWREREKSALHVTREAKLLKYIWKSRNKLLFRNRTV